MDKKAAPSVPPDTPSSLALQHDREIAALKQGQEGMERELHGIRQWTQKIESNLGLLAEEMRAGFSRASQRNPMLYVGLGTLCMGIITVASGLIFFTINAQLMPLREARSIHDKLIERHDELQRRDFEMLIRHDERLKHLQGGN
jgi:hypothetical protein